MSGPDLSATEQIEVMTPAESTLLVQRLVADNAELQMALATTQARVVEFEAGPALERRQRGNKHHAAPFSKGNTPGLSH